MWFLFALITLFCWSFSDLFSKIGCSDEKDRYAPLKMITAVGFVMGIHALYGMRVKGTEISTHVILTYLPVSMLYIASMAIGYIGLKYIELSISSPICNSSGALVALISLLVYGLGDNPEKSIIPIVLVCAGVIGVGIADYREDEQERIKRQSASSRFYRKSVLAILIPVIYCVLDALGTFADSYVLEFIEEESANTAYELTFFVCGIICFIYVVFIKKQEYLLKREAVKYLGALFETAGQYFYIYAIADRAHVMYSAPIISSYCVLSVVWGSIFLKEKLSIKHYMALGLVIIGIFILGGMDL